MRIHDISDSELELMKIIWLQNGKALLADIMNQLSEQGNNWQNNTVITFLWWRKDFSKQTKSAGKMNTVLLSVKKSTRLHRHKHWWTNSMRVMPKACF